MGSKIEAKAAMRAAGLPVLLDSTVVEDPAEIGYPLLVKASAGGGGRGLRIVAEPAELTQALADAGREAAASFGDGTVFCERYVPRGRHVEIQIVADSHGDVVSLHERECSIQRRHQKIVEESPSPAVDADLRERMSAAAITAARAIGYVGVGTVEFLLEADGRFWFLEMNTRLQVEHPVTELVTGLDLVEVQLAVAEGARLPAAALNAPLNGHAIEARLTAEDPAAAYRPSTGTFTRFEIPADAGVRVDSGVETGSTVPPYYDSLVAKVVAHGPTRDAAIRTLVAALRRSRLEGPTTNRDQLVRVLEHDAFRSGDLHTEFLAEHDTTAPLTGRLDVAAAAVALAEAAANRARATVLGAVPAGWRNNPAVMPSIALRHGDSDVIVRYELGADPGVEVGFAELAPAELVDLRIGTWTARPGRPRGRRRAPGVRDRARRHAALRARARRSDDVRRAPPFPAARTGRDRGLAGGSDAGRGAARDRRAGGGRDRRPGARRDRGDEDGASDRRPPRRPCRRGHGRSPATRSRRGRSS